MKKVFVIITGIIAASLFLISCGDDYTLEVFGSVSGQVTEYSTGEPLVNSQVTLIPGAQTTQTGTDGSFSFSGLYAGQYVVSVQKNGYQSNRKNVTVISGEVVSIVVPLSKIPK